MATTRVWNITSDPNTDVAAQNLMVLGKLLKPGQSMQVEEGLLKNAHKVKKDIERQLLAVGKTPPSYLAPKVKATLPDSVARAHGGVPVVAIAADASAKIEEKLSEKNDSQSVESDSDYKGFGKHRKGR